VEIHPGVFVSSTAAEDWRPDREVGGELHVLVEDETAYAGMSRFGAVTDPEPWTLPEMLLCHVKAGRGSDWNTSRAM
jgi:hypothetical protein